MRNSIVYFCLLVCCITVRAEELKLWYSHPAEEWVEALPLGNSRLGAMIYGNPFEEEIQLNEETVWGGSPYRNDNPEAYGVLSEVRKLIFAGREITAEKLWNCLLYTSHRPSFSIKLNHSSPHASGNRISSSSLGEPGVGRKSKDASGVSL